MVTLEVPRVMVPLCPIYVHMFHMCPFCVVSWDALNLETLVAPRIMVLVCPVCPIYVLSVTSPDNARSGPRHNAGTHSQKVPCIVTLFSNYLTFEKYTYSLYF